MRTTLLAAALAMIAALASSDLAMGQDSPSSRLDPSPQLAQADTARASRIGRLGFAYPPNRTSDKDLATLVQFVADSADMQCSATETFMWPSVEQTSERAQEIFMAFDQALHIKGYDAVLQDVKPPTGDPQAEAAHLNVLAYTAQSRNVNADDVLIVFLWHFEGDEIHLALCRAEAKKGDSDEE